MVSATSPPPRLPRVSRLSTEYRSVGIVTTQIPRAIPELPTGYEIDLGSDDPGPGRVPPARRSIRVLLPETAPPAPWPNRWMRRVLTLPRLLGLASW